MNLLADSKFFVRLVSFGAPNPRKMFLGPSHLAHAFDKLMFDYVYVFLEREVVARRKMAGILERARKTRNVRRERAIMKSMKELLNIDVA